MRLAPPLLWGCFVGHLIGAAALDGIDETSRVSSIVNRELEASVVAHQWPSTAQSTICEAYVYHMQEGKGPEFLDRLADEDFDVELTYGLAMEKVLSATPLVGTPKQLLEVSLTMRAQSPQCELYRGLAREAILQQAPELLMDPPDVMAVVDGMLVTDNVVNVCQSKSTPSKVETIPEEQVVAAGATDASYFLFGNIGTPTFLKAYKKLREHGLPFLVRHIGVVGHEEDMSKTPGTYLQGYGIQLDIRNVEYKVFDDGDGAESDAADTVDLNDPNLKAPDEFIAGVNLTALGLADDQTLVRDLWATHEAFDSQSGMIPPLWRMRHLPLQATSSIVHSTTDPLVTLQQITQDLPNLANNLVHVEVPDYVSKAVDVFYQSGALRPGLLYINGFPYAAGMGSFNAFEIFRIIRKEQNNLESLNRKMKDLPHRARLAIQKAWMNGKMFLKGDLDEELEIDLDLDFGAEKEEEPTELPPRIDVARGWKRAVIYMNDVEKDKQYEKWPKSVRYMVMSMNNGQAPSLRRNLYTVLSVMDPLVDPDNSGLNLVLQLIKAQYPARAGLLMVDQADFAECEGLLKSGKLKDGEPCPVKPMYDKDTPMEDLPRIPANTQSLHRLITMAARDLKDMPGGLMAYYEYLLHYIKDVKNSDEIFSLGNLLRFHGQVYGSFQVGDPREASSNAFRSFLVKDPEGDYENYGYAVRFAVERSLVPGMAFLNGRPLPVDYMDETTARIFGEEQNFLMSLMEAQEITDKYPKSVYAYLLTGDHVHKNCHPLIVGTPGDEDKYLEIEDAFGTDAMLTTPTFAHQFGFPFVIDGYFDFSTKEGINQALAFLTAMGTAKKKIGKVYARLTYRLLPSTPEAAAEGICPLLSKASDLGEEKLREILKDYTSMTTAQLSKKVEGIPSEVFESTACSSISYLKNDGLPDKHFIVGNGRVYKPGDNLVQASDVELLAYLERDSVGSVSRLFTGHMDFQSKEDFLTIAQVSALLLSEAATAGRTRISDVIDTLEKQANANLQSVFMKWNGDGTSEEDEAPLKVHVAAVIDPLSESAQRLAPILMMIRDQLKLPVEVALFPPQLLRSDAYIPVTSYYRFVYDWNNIPDVAPPKAVFSNLPAKHVLTVRTDVPEPWDVQQAYAPQDTDNLRCTGPSACGDGDPEKPHLTKVEYDLKSLLVFGQCYEAKGSSPNGLQLTLANSNDLGLKEGAGQVEIGLNGESIMSDNASTSDASDNIGTMVMKTAGYWQVRAKPGIFTLEVLKGSKGASMFEQVDGRAKNGQLVVNKDTPPKPVAMKVVVQDFGNLAELLVVQRKEGYSEQTSLFHDTDKQVQTSDDDDTIHVFSLATGHLYERFLKIMMLSVTKRTSSKVKFWLFENFLSPTFKETAQEMARQAGFEVEFVTYKWPQWLRGQSEKQRIIWGYKILFLDVLFPLNLKKIIYVDADQVVRGDLKELWDMDLQGAPYGYTPFCSSREETLGYQFWRDGFWRDHLRGKPYHISALYVVDLEKFRSQLVGDTLRALYQQLSADPASLANLDQDLPNYAQHVVPIFSLPQEWLWCESWCSDESKPKAKTIDLCNNPRYKEPKVSMAKRVISGELFEESWIELDAEVTRLSGEAE